MKAKQLRRKGIVPASIYGRNLKEPILIQIPLVEANRFISKSSKGTKLTIEIEEEKYNVLFKDLTHQPVSQQVEQMEFQHIVADEAVNSVAKVVLENRDKNQHLIQLHIEEIPYNALPKDFVQEIVIDLDGMKVGSVVKVEDLEIAKNENIKLLIPEDIMILSITDNKRVASKEEDEEEA